MDNKGRGDFEGDIVPENAGDPQTVSELRLRVAELESAVAARDNFLAIAAHELRNPMTPIYGQVQRLHRLALAGECDVADFEHGMRRIKALIELYIKRSTTLLDVSRITSGKLTLDYGTVHLSSLIRELIANHEPAARYSQCDIVSDVQDGVVCRADRVALEQIFDNLLLNAIKYGAGKPVEVSLRADAADVEIIVRDHGIGISAEAQKRIFERFERAVASGSQTGFGIGLWVVAQLVDAMDGRIAVTSAPDQGSVFCVRLSRSGG